MIEKLLLDSKASTISVLVRSITKVRQHQIEWNVECFYTYFEYDSSSLRLGHSAPESTDHAHGMMYDTSVKGVSASLLLHINKILFSGTVLSSKWTTLPFAWCRDCAANVLWLMFGK